MLDANGDPILASDDAVHDRVYIIGNIPGQVFSESIAEHEALQNKALDKLSDLHVMRMFKAMDRKAGSDFDEVFSFPYSQSNYIVAFESEHPLTSRTLEFTSGTAAAEVWRRNEEFIMRRYKF
jgi:hypothetical protein